MIIDIHVHARGDETTPQILEQMDAAGLDQICLFGPQPDSDIMAVRWSMREACDWLAGIARQAPERILPFAWIEPTIAGAVDELERAVVDLGFKGVKMIPNHWSPTDERVFPVYEKIGALGVPVLFHSGILFANEDSSRFCRPVLYEVLLHFPKVRFALAHISWPWVDECLAVYGRFRAATRGTGQPVQMWIDTCPGTPVPWRAEAIQKALAYAGDDHLLWGSDSTGENLAAHASEVLAGDRRILHQQLGVHGPTEERWMGENARVFLGL
jgi:predicted TIM-barrel fold metal-dependent hydrolase